MSTLLTVVQYASDSYMQSTGTIPANAVQVAIDMAEADVSSALGYPAASDGSPTFVEYQDAEEQRWPRPDRSILLKRPRIITIDSVLALHSIDCDCDWTELTACAYIHAPDISQIRVRACGQATNCWTRCACPQRAQVTYTSGFAAADVLETTPLGRALRMAIALQAAALMRNMDHYTEGTVGVKSWGSLGYNETRDLIRSATGRRMGLSILSQQAADILTPYIIRRMGPFVLRSQ